MQVLLVGAQSFLLIASTTILFQAETTEISSNDQSYILVKRHNFIRSIRTATNHVSAQSKTAFTKI